MSTQPAFVETHPCAHTIRPVSREMCVHFSSIVQKNVDGCCRSRCRSDWRICRMCVTLAERDRSHGAVDPLSGLCATHGGEVLVTVEAVLTPVQLSGEIIEIAPEKIAPLPNQPRKFFDLEKIKQLADSIKHRGQIQPGLVIATPGEATPYQLRDGERRLRACVLAGVNFRATVQTTVDEGTNEALLTSAAANFNREGHTPWEEIDLVKRLINPCPDTGKRFTVTQVAESLGKHIVWVSARKVVGDRLADDALTYIAEQTQIPFATIKFIADLPLEEHLKALNDYVEGKVSTQSLQMRAGVTRRDEGRSRNLKPSDVWTSGRDVVRTIDAKIDRLHYVFSTEALNGLLRSMALEQGEELAQRLEESARRLSSQARLIRSIK